MIRKIIEETGVDIDVDDSGLVLVTSNNPEMSEKAVLWIKNIVKVPEAGEIYKGKVVRIMDFGAFVEILPGKDGMIHISKLAATRVNKVTDVVTEGMEVTVKVIEIDSQGRINLSLVEGGNTPPPFNGEFGGGRDSDRRSSFGHGGSGGRGGRDDKKGFFQRRER
jgi:polyribonucleotide nucleotidyltransferase